MNQKNQQNAASAAGNSASSAGNASQQVKDAFTGLKFSRGNKRKLTLTQKVFAFIIILLAVLFVLALICSEIVPDILWYSQLGFLNVLAVKYFIPSSIFILGFILSFVASMLSLNLTWKLRPTYAVATLDVSTIEAFKDSIKHNKNKIFIGVSAVIGVLFGLILASSTDEFILMFGNNPFGKTDAVFGQDISFYTFVLPGLISVIGSAIGLFSISLIVAFIAGYCFGNVGGAKKRMKFGVVNTIKVSKGLRVQLGIYAAIISLLLGGIVYLSRYSYLTEISSRITGVTWTSANITIPVLTYLPILFVVAAIMFIVAAFAGNIRPPVYTLIALAVVAVFAVAVIPAIAQNLKVNPNAQELESPYINMNIDATKDAFGLNNIDVQQYNATTDAKRGALKNDAETTASIRLLDPQIVAPTYRQLQQNKQYYGFQDTLSVDKYTLIDKDGKSQSRDTVIAARELDLSGSDQRNWVNDHTVYTHGFGLVAGYGNQATVDGRPLFFEKDIPTDGLLTDQKKYEPRLYFSKEAPEYSIVGSDKEDSKWEFDYPEATENVTFEGNGGPEISNPFVKFLYAIKFGAYQMFFSDRVNSKSQILYDRDPAERVEKVAPYLTLDGRVYPAAVDGRVKWIVDAYTVTDKFPNSAMVDLGASTKDTLTETSASISNLESVPANYIRNSVKATVDAYDGSVTLYAWDADDPVLKAWAKIYGSNLHPVSEISGDLMSHFRYPESLFKVQRSLLAKYHVGSASAFFSGEDFWQSPNDPTNSGTVNAKGRTETGVKQPPYYLTLQMPGQNQPTFALTSTFIPGGGSKREILTGFLSADSDAGNEAGKIGENYGKLRLLELPKNTTVPGPGQAQNNFNSNADVSKELNLLSQGATNVKRGNLLTLPIGGGLVYIQPVYVQSTGETSFPLLKKVLVAFGDKVGFANTLDDALNQVFAGDSGVNVGNENSTIVEGEVNGVVPGDSQSSDGDSDSNEPAPNPTDKATPQSVEEARKALEEAQKALQKALDALNSK